MNSGRMPTHIREYDANKMQSGIKSLAYTVADKSILAVGYKNGLIEVYDCKEKIQLLHKLESHKEPVYSLRFSPWLDGQTLILASVSEVLCFWNITHILNNPLENTQLRRSQRFSRRHSRSSIPSSLNATIESINGTLNDQINNNNNNHSSNNNHNNNTTINGTKNDQISTNGHHLAISNLGNGHAEADNTMNDTGAADVISPMSQLNESFINLQLSTPTSPVTPKLITDVPNVATVSPWKGKSGASIKPELLACIKFVGNAAEKLYANQTFTKFITIDSDGEIYYLDINYSDNI